MPAPEIEAAPKKSKATQKQKRSEQGKQIGYGVRR